MMMMMDGVGYSDTRMEVMPRPLAARCCICRLCSSVHRLPAYPPSA